MESQMDSPRKACGFPQRTDLRPALRVHSLPTPGAYGWKPLRAFHTAPCRVASAARFIAKIFPTLRNRPRRNSYTTRWDAGALGGDLHESSCQERACARSWNARLEHDCPRRAAPRRPIHVTGGMLSAAGGVPNRAAGPAFVLDGPLNQAAHDFTHAPRALSRDGGAAHPVVRDVHGDGGADAGGCG